MKNKLILLLFLLFVSVSSSAQKESVVKVTILNYDQGELMIRQGVKPDANGVAEITFDAGKDEIINLFYMTKNTIRRDRIYVYPGAKIEIKFDAKDCDAPLQIKGGDKRVNSYLAFFKQYVNTDFDAISKYDTDQFLRFMETYSKEFLPKIEMLKNKKNLYDKEMISQKLYHHKIVTFYYGIVSRGGKTVDERVEKLYRDALTEIDFNNPIYIGGEGYHDCMEDYIDREFKFDGKEDYFTARHQFIKRLFTDRVVLDYALSSNIGQSFDTVEPAILKDAIADYSATYNPEEGKRLEKKLNSRKRYYIGDAIPQLTYSDLDGQPVTLDHYKGKYIVVYFWATWCGPCKREAPYWEKLIEKYGDKNVEFITISIDKDLKTLVDYLAKEKKGGKHLHCDCTKDDYLVQTTFGIGGVPYYTIIDPEGKFVRVAAPRPSQEALQTILDKIL